MSTRIFAPSSPVLPTRSATIAFLRSSASVAQCAAAFSFWIAVMSAVTSTSRTIVSESAGNTEMIAKLAAIPRVLIFIILFSFRFLSRIFGRARAGRSIPKRGNGCPVPWAALVRRSFAGFPGDKEHIPARREEAPAEGRNRHVGVTFANHALRRVTKPANGDQA